MKGIIKSESEETIVNIINGFQCTLPSKSKPATLKTPFKLFIYSKKRGGVVIECTCDGLMGMSLSYGGSESKPTWYWHLSDVIVYETPKNLENFSKVCKVAESNSWDCYFCPKYDGRYDGCSLHFPILHAPLDWIYTQLAD